MTEAIAVGFIVATVYLTLIFWNLKRKYLEAKRKNLRQSEQIQKLLDESAYQSDNRQQIKELARESEFWKSQFNELSVSSSAKRLKELQDEIKVLSDLLMEVNRHANADATNNQSGSVRVDRRTR